MREHIISLVERIALRNRMSGPCDDDVETTAPYVDILPEETENEEPSPLDFSREPGRHREKMTRIYPEDE